MATGRKGELRIGLTISGAIALGAYEGGALAALIAAAQRVNEHKPDALRVDALRYQSIGRSASTVKSAQSRPGRAHRRRARVRRPSSRVPPKSLDRSSPEIQDGYRDNGIDMDHFPPSKLLWYTDGGTIDNEPLGRTLDITEGIDDSSDSPLGDASRLHVLITPDPAPPIEGDDYWSHPLPEPTWTRTGMRTLKLLRVQRLYDDLRAIEKKNSRINWTRRLERTLTELLEHPDGDPAHELSELADSIEGEKGAIKEADDLRARAPTPDTELARQLRRVLGAASGLAGKRDVSVAVVSPVLLPELRDGGKSPRDLLAGEFLGHFGGFLNEKLRENDFALGYRSMICWMKHAGNGLVHQGLDAELAAHAITGAEHAQRDWVARHGREWVEDQGGAALGNRPLREKLALVGVATRTALIVFRQILAKPPA